MQSFFSKRHNKNLPKKTTSSCFFFSKWVCQRLKVLTWFFDASSSTCVSTTTHTNLKFEICNLHKRSSGWNQNHEITIKSIWSLHATKLEIYHHMITFCFLGRILENGVEEHIRH
jgi:hypothetical protein